MSTQVLSRNVLDSDGQNALSITIPVTTSHTHVDEYDEIARMVDTLESYYTKHNIYKSVIFCANDDDTLFMENMLSRNHHSVCSVCVSDTFDERALYMSKIKAYESVIYRTIIVSYPILNEILPELEVYVLPEQNLIVFGGLPDICVHGIRDWLLDAKRRGFITSDTNMLMLQDYNGDGDVDIDIDDATDSDTYDGTI
ncbi:MAG: hypothetical protein EB127_15940 [Alphaproteobacteria bacterium]|nr:hypothetical protein [Alphaproteobacteria bacterium]